LLQHGVDPEVIQHSITGPIAVALDMIAEMERRAMSGARHRRKGSRVERELVNLHEGLCIKSERYPLSGASRFRGSGHDVDIYVFGADEAPLRR
jgi:hypothetical protein